MAQKNYIDEWEYVEVYRDNYTSKRCFKFPEEKAEAESYFNYLQSIDNQGKTIQLQNQIAEQLKRQDDLRRQQLTLEKDRIRKETEVKENNLLRNIAYTIDKEVFSVDSSLRNVRIIVEKGLFHFNNQKVILRIAEILENDNEFLSFFSSYGELPDVSERIVDNPNFANASVATLKFIIEKKLKDKGFICKLYSKNDIIHLWSGPQVLLDVSTLKLLISKNLVPSLYLNWVHDTIFWIENKQRILDGNIKNDEDLKFAECYYYESGFGYKFLLELANRTSLSKLLSIIESHTSGLTKEQTIQVFKVILWNPHYKYNSKYNSNLVNYLIDNMNTKESLLEIKQYCTDSMYDKWLNKMQQLGYIEENKRKTNNNGQNSFYSNKGCAIWFVVIICTVGLTILQCL